MAKLRKQNKGKYWYVDYIYKGKRIVRSTGETNKDAAQMVLDKIKAEIFYDRHQVKYSSRADLETIFATYLVNVKTRLAKGTLIRYEGVIKNMRLYLAVEHSDIKWPGQITSDVTEGYTRWRKTVDPRTLDVPYETKIKIPCNCGRGSDETINYEIKILRAAFKFAVDKKLCQVNPWQDVKPIRIRRESKFQWLTDDECKRLLDHARRFRPAFQTFLLTGLRLGELINLEWRDIDFRRKKLTVQSKRHWQPKTGGREIPLNSTMIAMLKSLLPNERAKDDYVFTYPKGTKTTARGAPFKEQYLRYQLKRIVARASIDKHIRIHDLRHTFASRLVMRGVDLATVRKLLGHSDIQTTMIYAHLAPDHLANAVEKLED